VILEVSCPIPVRKSFDYLAPSGLASDQLSTLVGRRVLIPFGFKDSIGLVTGVKTSSETTLERLKSIRSVVDSQPILSSEMIQLGEWLSRRYLCSLGEALFSLLPVGKGRARDSEEDVVRGPLSFDQIPAASTGLTADQARAVQFLHEAVHSDSPRPVLLLGEAATGKTEVYCSVIKDVLAQGKSALVLVPEIGLATQTFHMLRDRFGQEAVLFFHSDVTPKQRLEDWWKIKRGDYPVIVGPRSTILAPVSHLGAIIVDEEQDPAFKEDRKPRFHVRDVALARGQIQKALVVFSSATPSLEIMHAAET